MLPFHPARNRDATFSIRGYAYQVDQTILRWLGLARGEHLELEAGEDIDVVVRDLLVDGSAEARTLEQVKHREAPLSLRSPELAEALANFVAHKEANPSINLRFRFLTNALVARERPCPFADGRPGIVVWEDVRSGHLTDSEVPAALQAISELLRSLKRPGVLDESTWRTWMLFVDSASINDIHRLVSSFELSTGQPSAEPICDVVRSALSARCSLSSDAQASRLHSWLFFNVTRTLSSRGPKCLTSAALNDLLVPPSDESHDGRLLEQFETRLTGLDVRVTNVEITLAAHGDAIAALAARAGLTGDVSVGVAALDFSPPPRLQVLCRRAELRERLAARLRAGTWLHLYGSVGMGKSTLGWLIQESLGGLTIWVSMRGLDDVAASLVLERAVGRASQVLLRLPVALRSATIGAGSEPVLVFDDLPDLETTCELCQRLLHVPGWAAGTSVRILSSSHHRLPEPLLERAAADAICQELIPPLSLAETGALLAAGGAPDLFVGSRLVEGLHALSGGHPALVAAASRVFRTVAWNVPEAAIQLFRQQIEGGLLATQTVKQLVSSTQREEARELVYRLALSNDYFPFSAVERVAAVPPAVPRVREQLAAVLGLWVEERSSGSFAASQLLRAIARTELSAETRQRVHEAFAEDVLSKHELAPVDVAGVFFHLRQAGAVERAAAFLNLALRAALQGGSQGCSWLLALTFSPSELANPKDVGLVIVLRAQQAILATRTDTSPEPFLQQLVPLVSRAGDDDATALLFVAAQLVPSLAQRNFGAAMSLLATSLSRMSDLLERDRPRRLYSEFRVHDVAWYAALECSCAGDIDHFLNMLGALPGALASRVLSSKLASLGFQIVLEKPIPSSPAPVGADEAEPILRAHRRARELGSRLGSEDVIAAALRAEIRVHGEMLHDIQAVRSLAGEGSWTAFSSATARFTVAEGIGSTLLSMGRGAEAVSWLCEAVELDAPVSLRRLVNAAVGACEALGESDRLRAVKILERAAGRVEGNARLAQAADRTVAYGELAIARWRCDDRVGAFDAADVAMREALASRDSTDEWAQRFVALGHAVGYFAQVASYGAPPPPCADGSPYLEPPQGMINRYVPERARLLDQLRLDAPHSVMAAFAQGVGNFEAAGDWALRGWDAAEQSGNPLWLVTLSCHSIPAFVERGQHEKAIEAALSSMPSVVNAFEQFERTKSPRSSTDDSSGRESCEAPALSVRIDGMVRKAILPSVAARLARLATLQEPGLVGEVDSAVRAFHAAERVSPRPSCWRNACSLLATALGGRCERDAVLGHAQQAFSDQDWPLYVSASLLLAVAEDASLDLIVAHHVKALWLMAGWHWDFSTTQALLIGPFLRDYWTRALVSAPFQFNGLAQLKLDLASCCRDAVRHQPRRLLRAVFDSVNKNRFGLPREVTEWLRYSDGE